MFILNCSEKAKLLNDFFSNSVWKFENTTTEVTDPEPTLEQYDNILPVTASKFTY